MVVHTSEVKMRALEKALGVPVRIETQEVF